MKKLIWTIRSLAEDAREIRKSEIRRVSYFLYVLFSFILLCNLPLIASLLFAYECSGLLSRLLSSTSSPVSSIILRPSGNYLLPFIGESLSFHLNFVRFFESHFKHYQGIFLTSLDFSYASLIKPSPVICLDNSKGSFLINRKSYRLLGYHGFFGTFLINSFSVTNNPKFVENILFNVKKFFLSDGEKFIGYENSLDKIMNHFFVALTGEENFSMSKKCNSLAFEIIFSFFLGMGPDSSHYHLKDKLFRAFDDYLMLSNNVSSYYLAKDKNKFLTKNFSSRFLNRICSDFYDDFGLKEKDIKENRWDKTLYFFNHNEKIKNFVVKFLKVIVKERKCDFIEKKSSNKHLILQLYEIIDTMTCSFSDMNSVKNGGRVSESINDFDMSYKSTDANLRYDLMFIILIEDLYYNIVTHLKYSLHLLKYNNNFTLKMNYFINRIKDLEKEIRRNHMKKEHFKNLSFFKEKSVKSDLVSSPVKSPLSSLSSCYSKNKIGKNGLNSASRSINNIRDYKSSSASSISNAVENILWVLTPSNKQMNSGIGSKKNRSQNSSRYNGYLGCFSVDEGDEIQADIEEIEKEIENERLSTETSDELFLEISKKFASEDAIIPPSCVSTIQNKKDILLGNYRKFLLVNLAKIFQENSISIKNPTSLSLYRSLSNNIIEKNEYLHLDTAHLVGEKSSAPAYHLKKYYQIFENEIILLLHHQGVSEFLTPKSFQVGLRKDKPRVNLAEFCREEMKDANELQVANKSRLLKKLREIDYEIEQEIEQDLEDEKFWEEQLDEAGGWGREWGSRHDLDSFTSRVLLKFLHKLAYDYQWNSRLDEDEDNAELSESIRHREDSCYFENFAHKL